LKPQNGIATMANKGFICKLIAILSADFEVSQLNKHGFNLM